MAGGKSKGSAAVDVIIGAAIVIFVVLPLFSAVVERFILINKAQIARDAVDMTNMAVYNSLIAGELGKTGVDFFPDRTRQIYRTVLAENLRLDPELNPLPQSIADGRVSIESVEVYTEGLPLKCRDGTLLTRPSVHSRIIIPIKPSLYRKVVLDLYGKEAIDTSIHVDTEIPLDR